LFYLRASLNDVGPRRAVHRIRVRRDRFPLWVPPCRRRGRAPSLTGSWPSH